MATPRYPKHQCPVCQQQVAVSRTSGRVQLHGPETSRCPGSGTVVNLYGELTRDVSRIRGSVPALTLWRPWTSCFTALPEPVAKRHENRPWGTSYRGRMFLHAGQRWDGTALQVARRIIHRFDDDLDVDRLLPAGPAEYPTGVVAVADLVDVCSLSRWSVSYRCDCGPWAFPGQRHWRFANVRVLPEPVPCRGAQQVWYPPADVVAAVEAQLAEAVAR